LTLFKNVNYFLGKFKKAIVILRRERGITMACIVFMPKRIEQNQADN